MSELEAKQLKELREISDDLEALREHSTSPKASFMRGVFQGAGAIVGGVLALALLGWILGLLGFIPGFDSLEEYLSAIVGDIEHRR